MTPTRPVHLYAYVGNNPVNAIDPLGLDTLVITSGWNGGTNVFGHSAIATTGNGVDSYGMSDPYGASTTNYLQNQLADRNMTVTRILTTPQQEQAIRDYFTNKNFGPNSKYSATSHNCANATGGALNAAGLGGPANGLELPSDVGSEAQSLPGAATQTLPQGSQVPSSYQSFNRPW